MFCNRCGGCEIGEKTKNALITLVKGTVSAGLILFLLYRIDLEQFIINLRNFPWWGFPLISVAFSATVLVGAVRWTIFLEPFGKIGYFKLVALYFVGYFFNNFLPSGVGGDVVRGYVAGKQLGDMTAAYSSVVAERVAGILATVFLSLIALPFVPFKAEVVYAAVGLNISLWAGTLLFLLLPSEKIVRKLFGWLPAGIGEKLFEFVEMLRRYRKYPATLAKGFVASALYQGSIILVVYLTGKIAGASLTLPMYFAIVPLVWVISLIPISFNAIGVREGSFSHFFALFGSTSEMGLFVSLNVFGASLVAGIVGGIIFALWNSGQKKIPTNG